MAVSPELISNFKNGYLFEREHGLNFSKFSKISEIKIHKEYIVVRLLWMYTKSAEKPWIKSTKFGEKRLPISNCDKDFLKETKGKKLRFCLPFNITAVLYQKTNPPSALSEIGN